MSREEPRKRENTKSGSAPATHTPGKRSRFRGIRILGAASTLPAAQPVLQPALRGTAGESCAVRACPDSVGADVIAPSELRRLGRSQRMALAAAREALAQCPGVVVAGENTAVCVGTGLGALDDTAAFVENMVERDESEPRPARFINSVHNAIATRLAISLGCKGENHTFTHEAISFELALWQAMRLLQAGRAEQALVCGADEWSPYVIAAGRARGWRSTGVAPGEGAAAFLLRTAGEPADEFIPGTPNEGAAVLRAVRAEPLSLWDVARPDAEREVRFIRSVLARAGTELSEVDTILTGANGNERLDATYAAVLSALSGSAGRALVCGTFKDMCGEFCSASAIGLWRAVEMLRARSVRGIVLYGFLETGYHSACVVTSS